MYTLQDLARWMGGKLVGNASDLTGISSDSRDENLKGKVFFCLKGETFDGHKFLPDVSKKGIAAAVVEELFPEIKIPQILVNSTKQALIDAGAGLRDTLKIPVVAIIGSCGKTTTKDLIVHSLKKKFNLVYTKKNFNNTIGVPKTIFDCTKSTECLVLELGINMPGEMDELSKIAKPDFVVIPSFGKDHLEFLGSEENVIKENLKAIQHKKAHVFYYEEEHLEPYLKSYSLKPHILSAQKTFKIKKEDWEKERTTFEILDKNQKPHTFEVPLLGIHNIKNVALALSLSHFGFDISLSELNFQDMTLTHNRSQFIDLPKFKIYNDAYNSNPTSLEALRKMFESYPKSKSFILGGMRELGPKSNQFHEEAHKTFSKEKVLFVGQEWKSSRPKYYADKISSVDPKILEEFKNSSMIVLKGSRFYEIEKVIPILENSK